VLRKYNPTTRTYSTIANATFTPVTVGGQAATEISYQITDGGPYDLDGSANGTIVDPVGLAVTANAGTLSNTGVNLLLPAGAALAMLLIAIRVQRGSRQ